MSKPAFTFIDLFAGIGGMRAAFEAVGGRCVFTAEWNKFARKTYEAFFPEPEGSDHRFIDDINRAFDQIPCNGQHGSSLSLRPWSGDDPSTIPPHDVLLAGFPCQPFSIAGVSKKNSLGRSHGFDDPTQGTLFFNIKEILRERRPRAFLLENVKNLTTHDRKNTYRVICQSLTEVGYAFFDKVVDASLVVPQHRERIFIVGFDAERHGVQPGRYDGAATFWAHVDWALLERRAAMCTRFGGTDGKWPRVGDVLQNEVDPKYTLTPRLWEYLQAYKAKHKAAGNGFGFGMVNSDSLCTRTISARYYKDGSEVLIDQGPGQIPRRLTPLEALRLQGFPKAFERFYDGTETPPASDTQAYKQFGNAVCVPVVEAIARTIAARMQLPRDASVTELVRTAPEVRFDPGQQGQLPLAG